MSRRNHWERGLDRRPVRTLFQLGALGVVITFVLAVLGWGLVTGFSFWWGQGDAYRQKNSSQNWVAAQRAFHQENNDVTAFQAKIALAKQTLVAFNQQHPSVGNGTPYDPDLLQQSSLQSDLTGLQQQCLNTVQSYNTDAQSYLTQDWRDADLPQRLDPGSCN